MYTILLLSALATPILTGMALLAIARRKTRRRGKPSEVCRQYVYLFKGGHLSESSLQSARVALEPLLDRGEFERVEAALQPGKQFAVQTRALAEIGSEAARGILERQLERCIVDDVLEQAWYRLDLARSLRKMNRLQSMPVLIRAAAGPEGPLVHFLAAEAACFPGFAGFMYQLDKQLGRDALLVLLRALRGLRCGVEPRVVNAARLGEAVEILWDQRFDAVDPLTVQVFVEVRKLLQRAGHAERWFGIDEAAREAFREQIGRMEQFADGIDDYLDESTEPLLHRLTQASRREHEEILRALIDLKADTAPVVLPMLETDRLAARERAVESLVNSADPAVGMWLCAWLRRHAPSLRRRAPAEFPHVAVLQALRHHPSQEAEAMLVRASHHRDAQVRLAAMSSLGWWAPVRPEDVLTRLHEARLDRSPSVMTAAQAALGRLGERQALRWFRQQLAGESSDPIHRVIQLIGEEGLVMLWPDLDALADADDADIALHACEALEQLRDDMRVSSLPK